MLWMLLCLLSRSSILLLLSIQLCTFSHQALQLRVDLDRKSSRLIAAVMFTGMPYVKLLPHYFMLIVAGSTCTSSTNSIIKSLVSH